MSSDLPTRITDKVSQDQTGCWLWNGSKTQGGYGTVTYQGVHTYIHRLYYETFVGPIPDGHDVDHLCMVRRCCNPAHLEPTTRSENLRRAYARITHCPRGHEYRSIDVSAQGWKRCRICRAEDERSRRARKKEEQTYAV